MNIPSIIPSSLIQLKYIFGINTSISNNLHFKDEQTLLYPAGYHVVSYNFEEKTQTYYNGAEGYRGFSSMCLSPTRRFLALGLKGDKPSIIIFDTMTQKKKKTLPFNEGNIKEWVSLAFAPNAENKHLISLSGAGGDVYLCYWQYDKTKCIPMKISQSNIIVTELAFNPNDITYVSICGPKVFKFFRLTESSEDSSNKTPALKLVSPHISGVPSEINNAYTCHTWLSVVDNKVIVANEVGDLLILDGLCEYEDTIKNSPAVILKSAWKIQCIASYSKGFVVGGDNCQAFVYKFNEETKDHWEITHQFQPKPLNEFKETFILSLTITPNLEERLACILSNNMIFSAKLKSDLTEMIDQQDFRDHLLEPLTLSFHTGAINSMDISIRKPLIATCGVDKFIKIWNYEEKTLETSLLLQEEPHAISIHPSGFHLVVGTTDKILLMNIIPNHHIKFFHTIAFKACREVKYSTGGQYFAVVNGSSQNNQTIHIFNTYTGENPHILKGHNARIKSLYWSKDDTVLVSAGADGVILVWTLAFNGEFVKAPNFPNYSKSINFTCVTLTNDNKVVYAVGHGTGAGNNDKILKDVSAVDGVIENKKDMGIILTQVAFPTSNKLLFAGVGDEKSAGAVRCYKFPLTGHCFEYQAHDERGIEKMRVSYDDQFLITAGKDGCLMIFEIKDKEARGMKIKEGFTKPSDEILITRGELDIITDLTDQADQGLLDQKQSQNSTGGKDDLIKQLHEKLMTISQNNIKNYQNLLESKQDLEKKYEEELKNLKESFDTEIQELDTTYQKRVMHEVAQYEDSKKHQGIMNTKYEKEMKTLENTHNRNIKQLEDENNALLEFERQQREQLMQEKEDRRKEYQENLLQIKKETEEEMENLQERNKQDITGITDMQLKAKSEISLNKKRIAAQMLEYQDIEDKRKEKEENKAALKQQNLLLKDKIEEQKRLIQEHDRSIGEKENKISELKKRSQELERFKFVLDHKIKELKRDIVPREAAIAKMKEQTNEMDQKLKNCNNYNNALGETVNSLDLVQSTLNEEIKKKRTHISCQNVKIKQFKDDVYKAVQYIQNYPELKNQAISLFQKYSTKDLKPPEIDPDIDSEYRSQKKYLQKSVAMLKKNLDKDNEIHKQDNLRIMKENVDLIREINKLRKNIKDIKYPPKGNEQEKKNMNTSGIRDVSEDRIEGQGFVSENEQMLEIKKLYELQAKQLEDIKTKLAIIEKENQLLQK